MSDAAADARRRAHAHRRVSHPARRRPRVPRGQLTMLLGPQRRRQDHDAAHHHGPVAARRRAASASTAATSRSWRTPRHRARWASPTCPENMGIFADLTVQREHAAGRARRAARGADRRDAAATGSSRCFPALKKFWNHPAGKLSGGQKQMLAVARAIVEPRELLLIDEPSKGLAPAIINNMIAAFRELKAQRRHHPAGRAELQLRQAPRRHGGRDGRRPRRARRRHGATGRRRGTAAAPARPFAGRASMSDHRRPPSAADCEARLRRCCWCRCWRWSVLPLRRLAARPGSRSPSPAWRWA